MGLQTGTAGTAYKRFQDTEKSEDLQYHGITYHSGMLGMLGMFRPPGLGPISTASNVYEHELMAFTQVPLSCPISRSQISANKHHTQTLHVCHICLHWGGFGGLP